MKTLRLNPTEEAVLKSLFNQMMDCTGGEFGYTSDADKCGLSKHEFAGYVSALQAKGVFEYLQPLEHMKNVAQYALTEEVMEFCKDQKALPTEDTKPIVTALNKYGKFKVMAGQEVLLKNGDTAFITENKTISIRNFGVPTSLGVLIPSSIVSISKI